MIDPLANQIDTYIHEHLESALLDLERLCNQPSVSAQGLGIDACADLVATMLAEHGFEAEILPSKGNPVVIGESAGTSDRTLLLYLHYDVQPPEPLELWESPPFELTRRGDKLFARGVSDDKGHIVCRLAALDAVRAVAGELPCNIKFIIEGEEEVGSPSLESFVDENRTRLGGDACIWEFGGIDSHGSPTQTLGLRGACFVELRVRTAERDVHSGLGGSIMPNAAWRLVWALNSLKDAEENILIPGFYENVIPPSPREVELLAKLPDESQHLRELYGIAGYLKGIEGGLEWQKEAVYRPTCTVCGLTSGYQGAGSKTVQPALASAKLDFRLVPNQAPDEILEKLRAHLDRQGFDDVEIVVYAGEHPARVDPDDPFVQLTNRAARDVYGKESVIYPMIGGSGPLYPFVEYLGVPVVSAGLGYPDSRAHAPNENIRIPNFIDGARHTARIIRAFGTGG